VSAVTETRVKRHSWRPITSHTKQCTDCELIQQKRPHPYERRWFTEYQKGEVFFTADRTPGCGEPIQEALPEGERVRLADQLDYYAGVAYKAGDLDKAARYIADCRALDPARPDLWDLRERRIANGAVRLLGPKSLRDRIEQAGRQYPDELERWAAHNQAVYERAEPEL
jgi:hypothetical protein